MVSPLQVLNFGIPCPVNCKLFQLCLVLGNSLKLTSLKLVITYNSSCYSNFTALQASNLDLSIF